MQVSNFAAGARVESVEVKRRRLRSTVRQYRQRANLTQKEAADKLGWSNSKIVRLEQGTVPISPSDVVAMLRLYHEEDAGTVDELVDLAKAARAQTRYDQYRDIASKDYQELLGMEQSATVISKYEPSVVPGLFQTYEYAHHLSKALGGSERDVERQVDLRMQRQLMLDGAERPELHFIVGEAAFLRVVGGPEVMNEQFERLLQLSREDGINLWLLPFSAGPHRSMGGAFTILEFADPLLPDLLYLENAEGESTSRDEEGKIRVYKEIFIEIESMAAAAGAFEEQLERIRSRFPEG
jgi:DNA-binding XRE family transcriptional regulator